MGFISDCSITAQPPWILRAPAYLWWLFPLLPVEIILMKRKRRISLLCLKIQKGRYWYNQFCFFTHKVTPTWLGLDVAPEISGVCGALHLRRTTWYWLNGKGRDLASGYTENQVWTPRWEAKTASSLWKQCFYACETERKGAQILRKTGSHKNWLEPAKIKMVLSMAWPLTSNLLHLHYNTKIHSPLTMTGVVIVPRLTIKSQKWYRRWGSGFSCSKANKEARLVERNIYFILDASMWWKGRVGICLKANCLLPWEWMDKSFYRQR